MKDFFEVDDSWLEIHRNKIKDSSDVCSKEDIGDSSDNIEVKVKQKKGNKKDNAIFETTGDDIELSPRCFETPENHFNENLNDVSEEAI